MVLTFSVAGFEVEIFFRISLSVYEQCYISIYMFLSYILVVYHMEILLCFNYYFL